MKKILVMCYPTFGRKNEVHLNSKGESVVLAPDEMISILIGKGHTVDVVNVVDKKMTLPLMRSKQNIVNFKDISVEDYDVYWHMFRDPTQPEVLKALESRDIDYNGKKIINDIKYLKKHNKWEYLPILHKHGIGPKVLLKYNRNNTINWDWSKPCYSATVSIENKVIHTAATNNNRGDYPDRRSMENIYVEFLDNSASGVRSFFRVGYSLGKVTPGWLYCSDENVLTQKSGVCKHQIPFQIPDKYHAVIKESMEEMGIDVCHFEGLFIKDKLFIFDINPYPTAHGGTLSAVTSNICNVIEEKLL